MASRKKADSSMPDPSDLISQLKSRWTGLSALERAKAIAIIKRSGISNREIARGLQVSEALLRHLLQCLDASADDQGLARHNLITTNELARRGKAAKLQRAERHIATLEVQRAGSARQATDQICNWIIKERIYGSYGERIIEEVRNEFDLRERDGSLPTLPDHAALSLNELIRRSKPKRPLDDNAASVSWYAEWLCRWSFFAYEDPAVRDNALEQALERQWKR
jgi:transposase